jgi:hypothetical protein
VTSAARFESCHAQHPTGAAQHERAAWRAWSDAQRGERGAAYIAMSGISLATFVVVNAAHPARAHALSTHSTHNADVTTHTGFKGRAAPGGGCEGMSPTHR